MTVGWTTSRIPDQTGRTIIVTGANSGLGFETARALAGAGALVVMACRDERRARVAADAIRADEACGELEILPLDLASLASVRDFAKAFSDRHPALHVLINNAGIMAIPRRTTADGFEMQFGTNHLGHFALTALLLERLLAVEDSRVVSLSSTAHKFGRIDFDDLQRERSYFRWSVYGQSKLANLHFAYELERRFRATRTPCLSNACHPGWSATNLQYVGARMEGRGWLESLASGLNRLFSQDAAAGALPTLYAATAPEAKGGDFFGPDGLGEIKGHPRKVNSSRRSHELEAARRLWEVSEELTGVRFDALAAD